MADVKEVRRFFAASRMESGFALVIENVAASFATFVFADQPDEQIALQRFQLACMMHFKERIISFQVSLYAELFTNEEIRKLTQIYSTPAMQKLIDMQTTMQARSMEFASALNNEIAEFYDEFAVSGSLSSH